MFFLLLLLLLNQDLQGISSQAVDPRVTIDAYPSTQPVPLGTTVVLVCRVVGVSEEDPSASYQWSCPNRDCTSNIDVSRIKDGNSVSVNVLGRNDEGQYSCTVSGVTATYSMSVTGGLAFQSTQPGGILSDAVTVYYPKNGFITSTEQPQINGNDVVITCQTGEASPPVWYSPNGSEIGRGQTLIIGRFRNLFNGDYNCTSNSGISATIGLYLADEWTYDARVSNFRIETREARALQLAWEALTAANTSGYYVRHVPEDPPFNRQLSYIRVLNSASTSVELADLQPGTRYTISIWGFSVDGNNNWMVTSDNNTITATTEEFTPSQPRMMTILRFNSTSVILNWLPPVFPNGNLTYRVEYTMGTSDSFTPVPTNSGRLFFTLQLPEVFTTYRIRVIAVNSAGTNTSENMVEVCPGVNIQSVPTSPTSITFSVDRDEIRLQWQPASPRLCDGGVDHYTVQYSLVGGNTTSLNVTGTSVLLSNLEAGATYDIVVFAVNRMGPSLPSSLLSVNISGMSSLTPTRSNVIVIIQGSLAGGFILALILAIILGLGIFGAWKLWKRHQRVTDGYRFTTLQRSDISYMNVESLDSHLLASAGVEKSIHGYVNLPSIHSLALKESSSPPLKATGLPVDYFMDNVTQMHLQGRAAFLVEYTSFEVEETPSTLIGEKNIICNRYRNILPYDNNRVILSVPNAHGTDYINASYMDGYKVDNKFIATQGPISNSITDFWQMVWDHNVQGIVMLTKVMENNKVKCEQYFPVESGGSVSAERFEVRVNSLKYHVDYEVRRIELEQTSSKEILYVTHYLFTGWPDKGVPSYPTSLVHLLYRVKKERTSQDPIIVHCSAGVGRSGTFIALDCILDQINEENTVDIKGVVKKMREKRMLMVQTVEQYIFLYNAVREFLLCGDTSVRAVDLRKNISRMEAEEREGYRKQLEIVHLLTERGVSDERVTDLPNKIRYQDRAPWKGCHLYTTLIDKGRVEIVNAGFVDGYHSPKAFIAAQSPMATTVDDFWSMIWENKSHVVVLLCQLVENEEESSFPFWPEGVATTCTFGGLEVNLTGNKKKREFDLYKLSVKHPRHPTPLGVTLLHYKHWAEWSKPSDTSTLIQLIVNTQKLQQSCSDIPVVVTCNDGLGRSGTFIAIWSLIEQMKTEGQIDVLSTVKSIRTQRPEAVDRLEYFACCYEAIVDYLDSFQGYSNFEGLG